MKREGGCSWFTSIDNSDICCDSISSSSLSLSTSLTHNYDDHIAYALYYGKEKLSEGVVDRYLVGDVKMNGRENPWEMMKTKQIVMNIYQPSE